MATALGAALAGAALAWFVRGQILGRLVSGLAVVVAAARAGDLGARHAKAPGLANELGQDLNALLETMADMAGELREKTELAGELASRVEQDAQGIRDMRVRYEECRRQDLANASETLERTIDGLQALSGDMGRTAETVRQEADSQQALVNEAAASMEQMNASIAEVAGSATAATRGAEEARERAVEGGRLVESTVDSIGQANERTARLSEGLAHLGRQAEGIGNIMGVISDIADQTNLLALNAAIEAARAGDAGRGFAVVADEVRKLAEKTMNATRDVARQIEAIQGGVRGSLAEMKQALELVGKAADLAGVSGKALEEIVSLSEDTLAQVRGMAAAATQQAQASGEINRVMANVHEISVATAGGMARSEALVGGLVAKVDELAVMNDVFRFIGQGEVQALINRLAASSDLMSMDRGRQERLLREAMSQASYLELFYVTDATGRQVVSNISRPGRGTAADAQAHGRDWSGRPWFKGPMASGALYISDVYVSSATGGNCVTVSGPFHGPGGDILGIIAADVMLGAA